MDHVTILEIVRPTHPFCMHRFSLLYFPVNKQCPLSASGELGTMQLLLHCSCTCTPTQQGCQLLAFDTHHVRDSLSVVVASQCMTVG